MSNKLWYKNRGNCITHFISFDRANMSETKKWRHITYENFIPSHQLSKISQIILDVFEFLLYQMSMVDILVSVWTLAG